MRAYLILIISVLLFGCKSSLQHKIEKDKYVFNISLNSCYDKDKVSAQINDVILLENTSVTSNRILGTTGVLFTYYKYKNEGKLQITTKDKTIEKNISLGNNPYKLKITMNNYDNYFILRLDKGRNILVDGCGDGSGNGKMNINYYRGIIYLD